MSFMEPETYCGEYYEIDTPDGTTFLPADVHPGASSPAELRDYVDSVGDPDDWTLELKTGWLGRYQAPGYMDCTPWEPGDDEDSLLAELRDRYGDDEDDTEDDPADDA